MMSTRRFAVRVPFHLMLAFSLWCLPVAPARAQVSQAAVDRLLSRIPPDARAIIGAPRMEAWNEDVTQALTGMQRVDVLVGTRPLDQVKSLVGLPTAVDDHADAALIVLPTADEDADRMWDVVVLVSITSGDMFLRSNFEPVEGEDDAYLIGAGRKVYVRVLDEYALISDRADAVRSYDPGRGCAEVLRQTVGERGMSMLTVGELFCFARRDVIDELRRSALNVAGLVAPGDAAGLVDHALLSIDFDPLAIVIRDLTRFNGQHETGRVLVGDPAGGAHLDALPAVPYVVAGCMNVRGLGGAPVIRAATGLLALGDPGTWFEHVESVQMMAAPGDGPVLGNSAMVMRSENPRALHDAMRAAAPTGWEVSWMEERELGGVSGLRRFTARPVAAPANIIDSLLMVLLFGGNRVTGMLRPADDAVLASLGPQPGMLATLLHRLENGSTEAGLEQDHIVTMMRTWMPEPRDVELYVSLERLAGTWNAGIDRLPARMRPPRLDVPPGAPPIGFGLSLSGRVLESTLIVPAADAAALLDAATSRLGSPPAESPRP